MALFEDGEYICFEMIDSLEQVMEVVKKLRRYPRIAVDIQGDELGRFGTISIIQIATPNKEVYLFDITKLQHSAFSEGLSSLFTDPLVQKVFFDVRTDCDALFHLFQITPISIIDCQIVCMSSPSRANSKFLVSLKGEVQENSTFTFEEVTAMTKIN